MTSKSTDKVSILCSLTKGKNIASLASTFLHIPVFLSYSLISLQLYCRSKNLTKNLFEVDGINTYADYFWNISVLPLREIYKYSWLFDEKLPVYTVVSSFSRYYIDPVYRSITHNNASVGD